MKTTTVSLLLACSLPMAPSALAQVLPVTDDFNDGDDVGWIRYAPIENVPAPGNAPASWTFPPDGETETGKAYRLQQAAPRDTSAGPPRIGSFRNDVYTDFFAAVDYVTWDSSLAGNFNAVLGRVPNLGTPPLNGYFVAYNELGPGNRFGLFLNVKFVAEGAVFADIIDNYLGGAAIVPRLDNSRRYRAIFTGTSTSSILRGALYDRYDLLEPIARIAFFDAEFPSGASGIASVNGNSSLPTDSTFDNYYSSGDAANFVGYPGTPQVVELTPAPQTLFYQPSSPSIQFRVRTFNANQIDISSLRMLLNGVNVTPQLTVTPAWGLLDPPNAHYAVEYSGALTADTIYQGQILVNDTSGKGTTNHWVFDTFQPFDDVDEFNETGRFIVEAEDYNHSGGMFDDYPPVNSYGEMSGIAEIDFHDARTAVDRAQENQYRPNPIGTYRDAYGAVDTPRAKYVNALAQEYLVWQMDRGEWLNYTRTFPSNQYRIYLRAASTARQDVRLDEVTSDRAQPDQSTCPLGTFLMPKTGSSTRFRYVPLTDPLGNPQIVTLNDVQTLRLTAVEASTQGDLGDLSLNYLMLIPASAQGTTLGPWIATASPSRDATEVDPEPEISILILNRDTQVDQGTIELRFDGVDVTADAQLTPTSDCGGGVRIQYRPPGFLRPRSLHTIVLAFSDNGSPVQRLTNEWSFTIKDVPVIPSAYARSGDGLERGFIVQVHKASNGAPDGDFPNSAERAERQLAGQIIDPGTTQPYPNEAAGANGLGIYGESSGINYEQGGAGAGFLPHDNTYPGVPQSDANHLAMAATAYLELAPGVYRFGGYSDDGFLVTTGPDLPARDLVVGSLPGCCAAVEFDFIVDTAGFYAFRFLHWEGVGGAFVEFYSVNRRTGERTLINELSSPTSVRAYRVPGQDLNLPTVPATFAHPAGIGADRGLTVQIHKAPNDAPETDFPNNADRAERQLAGTLPYPNEADTEANGGFHNVDNINYEQAGLTQGWFAGDTAFPGIDPTFYANSDPNYIAMAAMGYLELVPGRYRMGVRSDDGFKATGGASLNDPSFLLGIFEGGRGSSATEFEFLVSQSGLYPLRMLTYEGIGGADAEWYSVDLNTGERLLINGASPNAIKAYRQVVYRLINPRLEEGVFRASFQTVPGRTFTVEYKNNLTDPEWTAFPAVPGDGTVQSFSDSHALPTRFYRLNVQ